jgi:hypothetical protein
LELLLFPAPLGLLKSFKESESSELDETKDDDDDEAEVETVDKADVGWAKVATS